VYPGSGGEFEMVPDGRAAAAHLLQNEPTFHIGIANVIFSMRSPDMQKKIADALREAGLPD
jgi:hypothetical protein